MSHRRNMSGDSTFLSDAAVPEEHPDKHDTLTQCRANAGLASQTVGQHEMPAEMPAGLYTLCGAEMTHQ